MPSTETPSIALNQAPNQGNFTPQDWALFASISLVWGSSFLLIAFALEGLTPGMITLCRVGGGAMTLGLIRSFRRTAVSIDRADLPRIFLLSVTWVAVPFTLFPLAQEYINSALTGLLNGATPVFAAVVSTVLLKVAPKGKQLLGLSLGFAGVALISLASGISGSSEARGILMVIAASVCYGIAMNVAFPLQSKYGAIPLMSSVLGVATLWVIPFGLVNFSENDWTIRPTLAVAFLGIVGTGLAYWIMATLVGRVGPIRASFITYLIPVVSLILGVAIREDSVAFGAIIGAGLTLGGAFLASRSTA